jgi:RNA polymerase sigma-70 factor (ECF subfamily)
LYFYALVLARNHASFINIKCQNPANANDSLESMNDHELITGLKQNEQAAFRILLERYQDLVVTTCFHFLHNRDDAHDIAQEVFIEVYRSISRFRQDAAISTWLYRIAANKSLNYLRKQKNRGLFFPIEKLFSREASVKNLSEPDFTKPLEKEAEFTARAKMLHNAIEALPANQKSAFTLHKFSSLPYKEIAEVMEISLPAVESLIHRAKKNLQARLIKTIEKQQF